MTDIHGNYNEMIALLKKAQFNPSQDQLIIGGDMIDRGPDSGKVLQYLKQLQEQYPEQVKIVIGNHEDMLISFYERKSTMWMNFAKEAIRSFEREFTEKEYEQIMIWLENQPVLMEDNEYIYVHAGIVPGVSLSNQNRTHVLWMPYIQNGKNFNYDFSKESILQTTKGKKVIYGHTPRKYLFDDGARLCCDLGSGVKPTESKLALVNLTDYQYWYYDFDHQKIYFQKIAKKKN